MNSDIRLIMPYRDLFFSSEGGILRRSLRYLVANVENQRAVQDHPDLIEGTVSVQLRDIIEIRSRGLFDPLVTRHDRSFAPLRPWLLEHHIQMNNPRFDVIQFSNNEPLLACEVKTLFNDENPFGYTNYTNILHDLAKLSLVKKRYPELITMFLIIGKRRYIRELFENDVRHMYHNIDNRNDGLNWEQIPLNEFNQIANERFHSADINHIEVRRSRTDHLSPTYVLTFEVRTN